MLLLSLFALTNLAIAQEVIIATNISYADFAVGSVAASKTGSEIFFVEKDKIPAEILNEISEINPTTIYIIGGPAVISPEIENELSAKYNVTRIWGMTRYGTSAEVTKYFWPEGSEEAILVWDLPDSPNVNLSVSTMISLAAEEAQTQEAPLLLIQKNHLSYEIEDTLKTLNVSKVKVFGNVGNKVFEQLASLGIEYEWVSGEPEEIKEKMERELENRFTEEKPLVISAVANWQEGLVVRAVPKGVSLLVFSENEIDDIVEKVKEILGKGNISKILVTGKPFLAEKIYNALIEEGINQTTPVIWVTGKHFEVNRKIVREVRERIERLRELHRKRLEVIKEKLAKLRENIEDRCKYWYDEANSTVEEINTSVAIARYNLISSLKNECLQAIENNKAVQALKYLSQIKHEVRLLKWENRDVRRELIKEDIEEEEESGDKVREREERNVEAMISKVPLLPKRKNECTALLEKLREAIREKAYHEAKRLKVEITEKCFLVKRAQIAERVREIQKTTQIAERVREAGGITIRR